MKDNLKYYLEQPGVEKQLLVNLETAVRYPSNTSQYNDVNGNYKRMLAGTFFSTFKCIFFTRTL